MNQYETIFVMTPVLSDEQLKETVNEYVNLLKQKGAEVIHQDNWGLKKLAYPIKKKSTGFYHLIEFKGTGAVIADLELAYKRDERLLRFTTVSLDQHGVAFNDKFRGKSQKSKKEEDNSKLSVHKKSLVSIHKKTGLFLFC